MSTPNPERATKPGGATGPAKAAPLEPDARALWQPSHSPREFVSALVGAEHYPDAIRFVAHFLPRREGVWWAAQCIRLVPAVLLDPVKPILDVCEAWAADPTDELRRAAFSQGEAIGFDGAIGVLALATFWSEGSLAPPDVQAIAPPPDVAPNAVGNAVVLAAVSTEPELAPERFKKFLMLGFEVGAGTNRWKAPKAAPGSGSASRSVPLPPVRVPPPQSPPPPPPNRGYY